MTDIKESDGAARPGTALAANRKINVVVLNDSCEVNGGTARVAIDDACRIAQRGHRVLFFAASGRPPAETRGVEWISLGQHTILSHPNRAAAMVSGIWNRPAAKAFSALLDTLSPQDTVIHLHGWSKALSGSVVSVAHRKGYRVVCTLHDYFAVCPNGGLYDYPSRQVCQLRPMSTACMTRNCDSRARVHKIWRVLRQAVWRTFAGIPGRFDRMIAVSAFAAGKMAPFVPNRALIEVVDNLHQPEMLPLEQRDSIIYLGRISAEKGIDVYLQACRLAGIPAKVWGDGPALPELKAAWPEAGFMGWVPPEKLQALLGRALALVVPSLWYETYGMVVAEAAAAGTTVIVSDLGAAATLVDDGQTGLLFRNGDAADLAAKMIRLRDDREMAHAMGQAAYRKFWQGHLERGERRIGQIEDIYLDLLKPTV